MNKFLWLLAVLAALLLGSCGAQPTPAASTNTNPGVVAATGSYSTINVSQLKSKLDAKETFFLLDVRTAQEFSQDGRVAQAKLIPLQELETRLAELPRDQPVACICRSGNRSTTACDLLAKKGFNAINVEGGMNAWKAVGYPAVSP